MRYSKPELANTGSAANLVMSGSTKAGHLCRDASQGQGSTTGAYEIDE